MALSDTPSPLSGTAAVPAEESSYVDWPSILAGTVLSLAISFVLLTFGSALGLSFASPYQNHGISGFWFAVVAGLWLLWVQISACLAGGYLTGRLRRRKHDATEEESDVRDGSHGLVVWALGVLIGATVLVSGVSGAVSTAASAVGSAASTAATGAATGAAALAGNAVGGGDFSLLIDRYMRAAPAGAPPANGAAPAANGTPSNTPPDSAADTRQEVGRILATISDGDVSDADKQYLAQSLAARTGVDQATAEARVNDLITGAQQAVQKARDAAEKARKAALIAAFAAAASFFISAIGAYFGATLGGKHRDEGTFSQEWVPNFVRSRRW